MDRRRFVAALGGALAAPFARAQAPAGQFRIGVLLVGGEASMKRYLQPLLDGLRERGYVVGRNLTAEYRFVGKSNEMKAFADELVALKPDVLIASEVTAVFLKARTDTLPIILLTSADPVLVGLVQSLARPGTNVTGLAALMHPLAQKQLELLKEAVPGMSRVALLASPFAPPKDSPYYGRPEQFELALRRTADAMKLTLGVHRAGNGEELLAAFTAMAAQRTEGLVVSNESIIFRIPELSAEVQRSRIPAISGFTSFADGYGGLMSYGSDWRETNRYAAKFVDLILKGARPADIPVEQPTRIEFAINLKVAKVLNLKIPQSLLARADRVIE
jgi:putative ABC transport system substrate-binding protein